MPKAHRATDPPFDNFTPQDKADYAEKSVELSFTNKAAEVLWRTLPQLPEGGVFGVVVRQTILHSDNASGLRKVLVEEFELKEICLFPDKVFSFSDAESAVIIGRRKAGGGNASVSYRRIRERQLASFRLDPSLLKARAVPQSRLFDQASHSFNLPDLGEVWDVLRDHPTLGTVSSVGQGLIYRGRDLPRGGLTHANERFVGARLGFVTFDTGLLLNQLPSSHWMNLRGDVIRRPVSGTTVGTPQVLLNYAPVSRGPWRLKALIDREGHPVTSNFITVRPTTASVSLEVLWALLNGPIANAFAYSHLGKRDNIVGDIRKIPIPLQCASAALDQAVAAYWDAASKQTQPAELDRCCFALMRKVSSYTSYHWISNNRSSASLPIGSV